MSVYECWELEREPLKTALRGCDSMTDAAYAVRHAVMQTEQNVLAGQSDDVLRQQLGVLFSLVKNAVGFLDTPITATTWVASSRKEKKAAKLSLTLLSAGLTAACGLVCYLRGLLLGWVFALGALVCGGLALLGQRKAAKGGEAQHSEIKVTLQPDQDKLFSVLDGQMRSIDRCANDFAYLNEGLRGGEQGTGIAMLGRISDLLEALYECDDEARAPAQEAVKDLLADMGLRALDYSAESSKLFTALPSKNETRTLAPAIVSAEDSRLLRRGTAAVKTDAA